MENFNMQVQTFETICYAATDDDGYILYACCGPGNAPEGTTEITLEQYEKINKEKIDAYRLNVGEIVFDQERYDLLIGLKNQDGIRRQRQEECFSICDRAAWFYALTEEQKAEVLLWRHRWLDAPETGVTPDRPEWIEVR